MSDKRIKRPQSHPWDEERERSCCQDLVSVCKLVSEHQLNILLGCRQKNNSSDSSKCLSVCVSVSRDCVKFSTACVCVYVETLVGAARQTCCCCWWDSSSSSSSCSSCRRWWCRSPGWGSELLQGILQHSRQSCWLSCHPYECAWVWVCVSVLASLFFAAHNWPYVCNIFK